MIVESKREKLSYYLYLAPAFIVFAVFIFFPCVISFVLSFFKYSISSIGNASFKGIFYYELLFTQPIGNFWRALGNTAVYTLLTVVPSMLIGLLLALAINSKLLRAKTVFKAVYYIPYVSSMVAVALTFKMLFQPGNNGIINQIIMRLGGEPLAFYGESFGAMLIICLLGIWKNIGYIMVIYLGGLLGISDDIYDAVALDPITPFMKLRKIILPLLRPTTLFLLVTQTISSFQVFTPANIITGGGPGVATTTLVTLLYNAGFKEGNMGKASAIAVIIFVILAILTLVQNALVKEND